MPICNLLKWDRGFSLAHNWFPYCLTIPNRLLRVDDPRLGQNLGILVLIKTGPAAYMLSWQRHDRCHFASFVMYSPDAKFEEQPLTIFLEIFLIECCAASLKPPVTSSLNPFPPISANWHL